MTAKTVEELVDEVLRLRGRVLSVSRDTNEQRGLSGHSQGLVLSAIIHAQTPPTVARIARSFGLTRQAIQRTVNELHLNGLVDFLDNPEDLRTNRLRATTAGKRAHARFNDTRKQWLEKVETHIGADHIRHAVETLRRVRHYLEDIDKPK